MENQINEVESVDIASDEFLMKLEQLENTVDHHVKEEEGQLFTRMERTLSDDEAKTIGKKFTELKMTELKRMKDMRR